LRERLQCYLCEQKNFLYIMFSIKKSEFKTSQDFFRKIDLTYSLIILGPLLAFCYLYFIKFKYAPRYRVFWLESYQAMLLALIPITVLVFYFWFKKKEVTIILATKMTIKDKMIRYYAMNIKLFLILLVAFIITLVIQYFILDKIFNLTFAIVVIVASVGRPSSLRMSKLFKFDKATTKMIYTQQEIIETDSDDSIN